MGTPIPAVLAHEHHYDPTMHYRCAWCGETISQGPPKAPVSDGICQPCARREMAPRLHALMDDTDRRILSRPAPQLLAFRRVLGDLAARRVEIGLVTDAFMRERFL